MPGGAGIFHVLIPGDGRVRIDRNINSTITLHVLHFRKIFDQVIILLGTPVEQRRENPPKNLVSCKWSREQRFASS